LVDAIKRAPWSSPGIAARCAQELYHVVADERDLVGWRTNYHGQQVCVYHIKALASQARALLIDNRKEVNRLAEHPQWYNALTQNCTTTIRGHTQNVGAAGRLDWRLLANGHLDERLYERGQIDTHLPFEEFRARSNITERAKAADDSPDFSARIRHELCQEFNALAERGWKLPAELPLADTDLKQSPAAIVAGNKDECFGGSSLPCVPGR
jgi:hypothetical protein